MKPREVFLGDVLVIGAGASGLLTASQLRPHVEVALLDREGIAAAQSNHHHGYLHRGYIYVGGDTTLTQDLVRGAERWEELHAGIANAPIHETATIGFSDPLQAQIATHTWRAAELPVRRTKTSLPGWDSDFLGFRFITAEKTFDFTPAFAAVHADLGENRCLLAEVRRIIVKAGGGSVHAVEVQTASGERLWLRATMYLLAAGASNAGLLRAAIRYRGRAATRMSFMAIAAGESLPPTSMILPGNGSYGLFVVSRPLQNGGNAWLISNFLSLASDGNQPEARRLWLRSTLATLSETAPALRDPDLRWGLYDAPKGELRDSPGRMKAHSFEDYGLANLLALAPTKLTLAPLLADEVARETLNRLTGASARHESEPLQGLSVKPERWRREHLVPLADLCAAERSGEIAQALMPHRAIRPSRLPH